MLFNEKTKPLFEYTGISPKPADFDKFWDDSLLEMRIIDPKAEFIPAKWNFRNCDAFDLFYTGIGGARVHAKYLRPKGKENCPVIFTFHGYSALSEEFSTYLKYVCEGYCVAALDCRGQRGESQDVGGVIGNTQNGHIIRGLKSLNPKDLLFRSIFLDVAELIDIVEKLPEVDEKNMFTVGGSQGGALSFVGAALCPQIKGTVITYPFLSDYKKVYRDGGWEEVKNYFRNFDPRHENEDKIFETLGYIDIQNLAPRIKAKLLMFSALMDTTCPPMTQFAAYNKVNSEKDVIFYPDYGHEGLPEAQEITFQWLSEHLG